MGNNSCRSGWTPSLPRSTPCSPNDEAHDEFCRAALFLGYSREFSDGSKEIFHTDTIFFTANRFHFIMFTLSETILNFLVQNHHQEKKPLRIGSTGIVHILPSLSFSTFSTPISTDSTFSISITALCLDCTHPSYRLLGFRIRAENQRDSCKL